tara:strand:- start:7 stop:210 length:204 start_codon:yes stop_codon:yes gene_type:complete
MATAAEQLVEVQAAISATMKSQKFKHGDDENEMPDLQTLLDREKELKSEVSRSNRGPRVTGFRMRHG